MGVASLTPALGPQSLGGSVHSLHSELGQLKEHILTNTSLPYPSALMSLRRAPASMPVFMVDEVEVLPTVGQKSMEQPQSTNSLSPPLVDWGGKYRVPVPGKWTEEGRQHSSR